MVKAVVEHGTVRPLEPLPPEWRDGQELKIEPSDIREMSAEEIERDFKILESLCASSESADEVQLEHALRESDRTAKELVRREMGIA
jgi:hypothetical protein